MKKVNLKGISEILSQKEMKNVVGGGSMACHSLWCGNPHSGGLSITFPPSQLAHYQALYGHKAGCIWGRVGC